MNDTWDKICEGCGEPFTATHRNIVRCIRCKRKIFNISREGILERDLHRCKLCRSRENLEVHHIIKKIAREPEDLITLCKNCHTAIHNIRGNQDYKIRNADLLMELIHKCSTRYPTFPPNNNFCDLVEAIKERNKHNEY